MADTKIYIVVTEDWYGGASNNWMRAFTSRSLADEYAETIPKTHERFIYETELNTTEDLRIIELPKLLK